MRHFEVKDYHFPLFILLVSRSTRSISAGMLAIAFPYFILNNLHHNALFLGSIFALATLFTAFLGLFFGTITDTWGRKNTLILATTLLPVAGFLLWWSDSVPVLFLAAILGGFSATGSLAGGGIGGTVQPIQNTILADLAPKERRTFYFSSFAFLNGIMAALGTVTVKFIAVREVFLLSAIISLLGTIILLFLNTPDIKGKFRKLEGKIVIGKFTVTGFLNGVSQGLITPYFIPFFILFYNLPESRMASYTFISGIIAATSLLIAPYADRKFGFVKSIVYTRGLSVILILMFPVFRILPLALFIYCITPALRVLAIPIQQTAITSLVDENERGRALGINQVVRLVGSSAATELSGSLLSSPYIAIPFYLYGLVMSTNIYLYRRFFTKAETIN